MRALRARIEACPDRPDRYDSASGAPGRVAAHRREAVPPQPASSKGTDVIVWRGWGGLAVVYIGLGVGLLGGLLGSALLELPSVGPFVGLGLLIGGAGTAVHGWYLNVIRPRKKAAEWAEVERPRLEVAADQGSLAFDNVRPSSREEAGQLIDQAIEQGRRRIGQHGPHSVFWIPMEIIGILAMIIGLIVAVVTSIGALTG